MTQASLSETLVRLLTALVRVPSNLLLALFAFLGSPALLREKDTRIAYLEQQVKRLETERQDLQDRLLERNGVRPLTEGVATPSPALQREVVQPFEDWRRRDMLNELAELKELAEQDPVGYGALYEEATLRYNEILNTP